MSKETDADRYYAACHAMQSGVAAQMGFDAGDTEPKHLRVGVNVAQRDLSSLAQLLFAKGVITPEEYHRALADGMEEEAAMYEQKLSERIGKPIKLY